MGRLLKNVLNRSEWEHKSIIQFDTLPSTPHTAAVTAVSQHSLGVEGIKPITQSAYKTVNTFILFSIVTNSILATTSKEAEEKLRKGTLLLSAEYRDNTLFSSPRMYPFSFTPNYVWGYCMRAEVLSWGSHWQWWLLKDPRVELMCGCVGVSRYLHSFQRISPLMACLLQPFNIATKNRSFTSCFSSFRWAFVLLGGPFSRRIIEKNFFD